MQYLLYTELAAHCEHLACLYALGSLKQLCHSSAHAAIMHAGGYTVHKVCTYLQSSDQLRLLVLASCSQEVWMQHSQLQLALCQ